MMIAWVDGVAIVIIIGFSILGSSRGFFDQIIRFVPSWGTMAIMLKSQVLWPSFLDPWVPANYRSTAALAGAAVAAYPLLLLFIKSLIWRLGSTPLGIFNKIGGALIGFLQGTLLIGAISFCLWLTPVANEKAFQKSYVAKCVHPLVKKVSTQYLWIALKTQPKSWLDRVASNIWS